MGETEVKTAGETDTAGDRQTRQTDRDTRTQKDRERGLQRQRNVYTLIHPTPQIHRCAELVYYIKKWNVQAKPYIHTYYREHVDKPNEIQVHGLKMGDRKTGRQTETKRQSHREMKKYVCINIPGTRYIYTYTQAFILPTYINKCADTSTWWKMKQCRLKCHVETVAFEVYIRAHSLFTR